MARFPQSCSLRVFNLNTSRVGSRHEADAGRAVKELCWKHGFLRKPLAHFSAKTPLNGDGVHQSWALVHRISAAVRPA
jgi:hypothetical protein